MTKRNITLLSCLSVMLYAEAHACGPYDYDTFSVAETWTEIHNNLLAQKKSVRGTSYIASLQGNGILDKKHISQRRETIVFIPEATRPKEPVDFVFYFHGLGGFKERDFRTRTLRHTSAINSKKNYILIIPEMPWSENTSTPKTRQGQVFTKKGEFATFVHSIKLITHAHYIKHLKINKVILLGHSAGGSALMSISKFGGLKWLQQSTNATAIKIIFSDASYGRWLDITWKYFHPKNFNIQFVVLTRKWDTPYKNAKRFLNKFRKKPHNVNHIVFSRSTTHGDIGDRSFEWVYPSEDESGCGEGEKDE